MWLDRAEAQDGAVQSVLQRLPLHVAMVSVNTLVHGWASVGCVFLDGGNCATR